MNTEIKETLTIEQPLPECEVLRIADGVIEEFADALMELA